VFGGGGGGGGGGGEERLSGPPPPARIAKLGDAVKVGKGGERDPVGEMQLVAVPLGEFVGEYVGDNTGEVEPPPNPSPLPGGVGEAPRVLSGDREGVEEVVVVLALAAGLRGVGEMAGVRVWVELCERVEP